MQSEHGEPKRILVAMSGGVDSAVAAALLKEQGYDLIGVTLHLWAAGPSEQVGRCCAPEDREDASRVSEYLGIPHYVIDKREAFEQEVVRPLIDGYLAGATPSPCVHCNRTVKLTYLLSLAERFGASHVATGHYVRLRPSPEGTRLLKGRDQTKDQSYFLFGVPQQVLKRMIFPLGSMTKNETRAHGRRLGIPNADKPDSQELCFIPDGDVAGFIKSKRPDAVRSGHIEDEDGTVLGDHDGIVGFTVGQRKGLGLGGGPARYVLKIVPEERRLVVGSAESLKESALIAAEASWVLTPPESEFDAEVRIRYRHKPAKARIRPHHQTFSVEFAEPQHAVTKGQAAVIYREDEVVGGGFIQ
ncbi:MAG: tRNA 2-thiouridine(34) synthase MnmA [Myxococcota bacterium]